MISLKRLLLGLCLFSVSGQVKAIYLVAKKYDASNFFTGFDFQTFDDPGHGRVNFVDYRTASAENLTYTTPDGHIVLKVDSINTVLPTSRGRDSIRVESHDVYGNSLLVAAISHMPVGCGVWPRLWTTSAIGPYPSGGAIDIIEGVNNNIFNIASLHTTSGCAIQISDVDTKSSGHIVSTNCDAAVDSDQGCGQELKSPSSYGHGFNQNGGGIYAMERTSTHIAIWFFPRDGTPLDIIAGLPVPNILTWGKPSAFFPLGENCDKTHFNNHKIVIDTSLCGDYAGNTFTSSGCGPACIDFVDKNPFAFSEAYWAISSITVYTNNIL